MSHRPLSCVILLAAFTSLAAPGQAQTLQRGVVIDIDNAQAIIMLPEGGIDALSLSDGSRRWHSKQADMPVALNGGSLLALAGPAKRGLIHYAFIDPANGAERGSHFASLPTPARALVDDRLGEQFAIKADDDLLFWDYRHEAVTGALLASDQGPTPDGEASVETSKESSAIALSGTLRMDASQSKLIAESGAPDAGKALPVEIGQPQAGMPRRFRSADAAHVLVSSEAADGGYRWRIEDAKGQPIGEFDLGWSYLPFIVVDQAVLLVRPLGLRFADQPQIDFPTLVAFDLKSGLPRWQREIRDTAFRGPFPP